VRYSACLEGAQYNISLGPQPGLFKMHAEAFASQENILVMIITL